MKHIAKKRFGQHFLTDGGIVDAIVHAIKPQRNDWMVEIGPGLAALTNPLLAQLNALQVIELDRDLAAKLAKNPKLHVTQGDVLAIDFAKLYQQKNTEMGLLSDKKLRIVGNLPYNISSPILFHLLSFVDFVQDQHFMLQKEVVDRMVASPATSDYGRLSVMLQWRYDMQNILFVPPSAFEPAPRVDSAVVCMIPRSCFVDLEVSLLSELVKTAFSQRRKLLRHALEPWLQKRRYEGNFDLKRRAEEVSVHEYCQLALQIK